MSKVFKPNELVRVISLPWKGYGDDVVHIGNIVTIDHMKPFVRDSFSHFTVLKELLADSPFHNIGTRHLQFTGLRCNPSRNKREGKYAGYAFGQHNRTQRHGCTLAWIKENRKYIPKH